MKQICDYFDRDRFDYSQRKGADRIVHSKENLDEYNLDIHSSTK
jgi:hypothetical protein